MSKFEHEERRNLIADLLSRLALLKDFALQILGKISKSQETPLPENIGNWVADGYTMILKEAQKKEDYISFIYSVINMMKRSGLDNELMAIIALRIVLSLADNSFRNQNGTTNYKQIQQELSRLAPQYFPEADKALFSDVKVTRGFLELLGKKILRDFPFPD